VLPLSAGRKVANIGPRGVRALPLAAGINEGGHYLYILVSTKAKLGFIGLNESPTGF
jgi:hypothetical protein